MDGPRAFAKAVDVCPTCGAGLKEDECRWDLERKIFIAKGIAVGFTPLQARIFDIAWRVRNTGGIEGADQLMERVYFDDPKGGPETERNLRKCLVLMRRKLEPTGYTISKNNVGAPRLGYRLEKISC